MSNPGKTFLVLVFIAIFVFAVAYIYGIFWAVLGLLFLFFSLHSYFFATRYEIDAEKVVVKNIFGRQKRLLSEFKRVYKGRNGVLLSPFRRKTFLNNFRGIFLLLPAERAPIEEYLIEKIEAAGAFAGKDEPNAKGSSPGE